jgi:hypothetical protein
MFRTDSWSSWYACLVLNGLQLYIDKV